MTIRGENEVVDILLPGVERPIGEPFMLDGFDGRFYFETIWHMRGAHPLREGECHGDYWIEYFCEKSCGDRKYAKCVSLWLYFSPERGTWSVQDFSTKKEQGSPEHKELIFNLISFFLPICMREKNEIKGVVLCDA